MSIPDANPWVAWFALRNDKDKNAQKLLQTMQRVHRLMLTTGWMDTNRGTTSTVIPTFTSADDETTAAAIVFGNASKDLYRTCELLHRLTNGIGKQTIAAIQEVVSVAPAPGVEAVRSKVNQKIYESALKSANIDPPARPHRGPTVNIGSNSSVKGMLLDMQKHALVSVGDPGATDTLPDPPASAPRRWFYGKGSVFGYEVDSLVDMVYTQRENAKLQRTWNEFDAWKAYLENDAKQYGEEPGAHPMLSTHSALKDLQRASVDGKYDAFDDMKIAPDRIRATLARKNGIHPEVAIYARYVVASTAHSATPAQMWLMVDMKDDEESPKRTWTALFSAERVRCILAMHRVSPLDAELKGTFAPGGDFGLVRSMEDQIHDFFHSTDSDSSTVRSSTIFTLRLDIQTPDKDTADLLMQNRGEVPLAKMLYGTLSTLTSDVLELLFEYGLDKHSFGTLELLSDANTGTDSNLRAKDVVVRMLVDAEECLHRYDVTVAKESSLAVIGDYETHEAAIDMLERHRPHEVPPPIIMPFPQRGDCLFYVKVSNADGRTGNIEETVNEKHMRHWAEARLYALDDPAVLRDLKSLLKLATGVNEKCKYGLLKEGVLPRGETPENVQVREHDTNQIARLAALLEKRLLYEKLDYKVSVAHHKAYTLSTSSRPREALPLAVLSKALGVCATALSTSLDKRSAWCMFDFWLGVLHRMLGLVDHVDELPPELAEISVTGTNPLSNMKALVGGNFRAMIFFPANAYTNHIPRDQKMNGVVEDDPNLHKWTPKASDRSVWEGIIKTIRQAQMTADLLHRPLEDEGRSHIYSSVIDQISLQQLRTDHLYHAWQMWGRALSDSRESFNLDEYYAEVLSRAEDDADVTFLVDDYDPSTVPTAQLQRALLRSTASAGTNIAHQAFVSPAERLGRGVYEPRALMAKQKSLASVEKGLSLLLATCTLKMCADAAARGIVGFQFDGSYLSKSDSLRKVHYDLISDDVVNKCIECNVAAIAALRGGLDVSPSLTLFDRGNGASRFMNTVHNAHRDASNALTLVAQPLTTGASGAATAIKQESNPHLQYSAWVRLRFIHKDGLEDQKAEGLKSIKSYLSDWYVQIIGPSHPNWKDEATALDYWSLVTRGNEEEHDPLLKAMQEFRFDGFTLTRSDNDALQTLCGIATDICRLLYQHLSRDGPDSTPVKPGRVEAIEGTTMEHKGAFGHNQNIIVVRTSAAEALQIKAVGRTFAYFGGLGPTRPAATLSTPTAAPAQSRSSASIDNIPYFRASLDDVIRDVCEEDDLSTLKAELEFKSTPGITSRSVNLPGNGTMVDTVLVALSTLSQPTMEFLPGGRQMSMCIGRLLYRLYDSNTASTLSYVDDFFEGVAALVCVAKIPIEAQVMESVHMFNRQQSDQTQAIVSARGSSDALTGRAKARQSFAKWQEQLKSTQEAYQGQIPAAAQLVQLPEGDVTLQVSEWIQHYNKHKFQYALVRSVLVGVTHAAAIYNSSDGVLSWKISYAGLAYHLYNVIDLSAKHFFWTADASQKLNTTMATIIQLDTTSQSNEGILEQLKTTVGLEDLTADEMWAAMTILILSMRMPNQAHQSDVRLASQSNDLLLRSTLFAEYTNVEAAGQEPTTTLGISDDKQLMPAFLELADVFQNASSQRAVYTTVACTSAVAVLFMASHLAARTLLMVHAGEYAPLYYSPLQSPPPFNLTLWELVDKVGIPNGQVNTTRPHFDNVIKNNSNGVETAIIDMCMACLLLCANRYTAIKGSDGKENMQKFFSDRVVRPLANVAKSAAVYALITAAVREMTDAPTTSQPDVWDRMVGQEYDLLTMRQHADGEAAPVTRAIFDCIQLGSLGVLAFTPVRNLVCTLSNAFVRTDTRSTRSFTFCRTFLNAFELVTMMIYGGTMSGVVKSQFFVTGLLRNAFLDEASVTSMFLQISSLSMAMYGDLFIDQVFQLKESAESITTQQVGDYLKLTIESVELSNMTTVVAQVVVAAMTLAANAFVLRSSASSMAGVANSSESNRTPGRSRTFYAFLLGLSGAVVWFYKPVRDSKAFLMGKLIIASCTAVASIDKTSIAEAVGYNLSNSFSINADDLLNVTRIKRLWKTSYSFAQLAETERHTSNAAKLYADRRWRTNMRGSLWQQRFVDYIAPLSWLAGSYMGVRNLEQYQYLFKPALEAANAFASGAFVPSPASPLSSFSSGLLGPGAGPMAATAIQSAVMCNALKLTYDAATKMLSNSAARHRGVPTSYFSLVCESTWTLGYEALHGIAVAMASSTGDSTRISKSLFVASAACNEVFHCCSVVRDILSGYFYKAAGYLQLTPPQVQVLEYAFSGVNIAVAISLAIAIVTSENVDNVSTILSDKMANDTVSADQAQSFSVLRQVYVSGNGTVRAVAQGVLDMSSILFSNATVSSASSAGSADLSVRPTAWFNDLQQLFEGSEGSEDRAGHRSSSRLARMVKRYMLGSPSFDQDRVARMCIEVLAGKDHEREKPQFDRFGSVKTTLEKLSHMVPSLTNGADLPPLEPPFSGAVLSAIVEASGLPPAAPATTAAVEISALPPGPVPQIGASVETTANPLETAPSWPPAASSVALPIATTYQTITQDLTSASVLTDDINGNSRIVLDMTSASTVDHAASLISPDAAAACMKLDQNGQPTPFIDRNYSVRFPEIYPVVTPSDQALSMSPLRLSTAMSKLGFIQDPNQTGFWYCIFCACHGRQSTNPAGTATQVNIDMPATDKLPSIQRDVYLEAHRRAQQRAVSTRQDIIDEMRHELGVLGQVLTDPEKDQLLGATDAMFYARNPLKGRAVDTWEDIAEAWADVIVDGPLLPCMLGGLERGQPLPVPAEGQGLCVTPTLSQLLSLSRRAVDEVSDALGTFVACSADGTRILAQAHRKTLCAFAVSMGISFEAQAGSFVKLVGDGVAYHPTALVAKLAHVLNVVSLLSLGSLAIDAAATNNPNVEIDEDSRKGVSTDNSHTEAHGFVKTMVIKHGAIGPFYLHLRGEESIIKEIQDEDKPTSKSEEAANEGGIVKVISSFGAFRDIQRMHHCDVSVDQGHASLREHVLRRVCSPLLGKSDSGTRMVATKSAVLSAAADGSLYIGKNQESGANKFLLSKTLHAESAMQRATAMGGVFASTPLMYQTAAAIRESALAHGVKTVNDHTQNPANGPWGATRDVLKSGLATAASMHKWKAYGEASSAALVASTVSQTIVTDNLKAALKRTASTGILGSSITLGTSVFHLTSLFSSQDQINGQEYDTETREMFLWVLLAATGLIGTQTTQDFNTMFYLATAKVLQYSTAFALRKTAHLLDVSSELQNSFAVAKLVDLSKSMVPLPTIDIKWLKDRSQSFLTYMWPLLKKLKKVLPFLLAGGPFSYAVVNAESFVITSARITNIFAAQWINDLSPVMRPGNSSSILARTFETLADASFAAATTADLIGGFDVTGSAVMRRSFLAALAAASGINEYNFTNNVVQLSMQSFAHAGRSLLPFVEGDGKAFASMMASPLAIGKFEGISAALSSTMGGRRGSFSMQRSAEFSPWGGASSRLLTLAAYPALWGQVANDDIARGLQWVLKDQIDSACTYLRNSYLNTSRHLEDVASVMDPDKRGQASVSLLQELHDMHMDEYMSTTHGVTVEEAELAQLRKWLDEKAEGGASLSTLLAKVEYVQAISDTLRLTTIPLDFAMPKQLVEHLEQMFRGLLPQSEPASSVFLASAFTHYYLHNEAFTNIGQSDKFKLIAQALVVDPQSVLDISKTSKAAERMFGMWNKHFALSHGMNSYKSIQLPKIAAATSLGTMSTAVALLDPLRATSTAAALFRIAVEESIRKGVFGEETENADGESMVGIIAMSPFAVDSIMYDDDLLNVWVDTVLGENPSLSNLGELREVILELKAKSQSSKGTAATATQLTTALDRQKGSRWKLLVNARQWYFVNVIEPRLHAVHYQALIPIYKHAVYGTGAPEAAIPYLQPGMWGKIDLTNTPTQWHNNESPGGDAAGKAFFGAINKDGYDEGGDEYEKMALGTFRLFVSLPKEILEPFNQAGSPWKLVGADEELQKKRMAVKEAFHTTGAGHATYKTVDLITHGLDIAPAPLNIRGDQVEVNMPRLFHAIGQQLHETFPDDKIVSFHKAAKEGRQANSTRAKDEAISAVVDGILGESSLYKEISDTIRPLLNGAFKKIWTSNDPVNTTTVDEQETSQTLQLVGKFAAAYIILQNMSPGLLSTVLCHPSSQPAAIIVINAFSRSNQLEENYTSILLGMYALLQMGVCTFFSKSSSVKSPMDTAPGFLNVLLKSASSGTVAAISAALVLGASVSGPFVPAVPLIMHAGLRTVQGTYFKSDKLYHEQLEEYVKTAEDGSAKVLFTVDASVLKGANKTSQGDKIDHKDIFYELTRWRQVAVSLNAKLLTTYGGTLKVPTLSEEQKRKQVIREIESGELIFSAIAGKVDGKTITDDQIQAQHEELRLNRPLGTLADDLDLLYALARNYVSPRGRYEKSTDMTVRVVSSLVMWKGMVDPGAITAMLQPALLGAAALMTLDKRFLHSRRRLRGFNSSLEFEKDAVDRLPAPVAIADGFLPADDYLQAAIGQHNSGLCSFDPAKASISTAAPLARALSGEERTTSCTFRLNLALKKSRQHTSWFSSLFSAHKQYQMGVNPDDLIEWDPLAEDDRQPHLRTLPLKREEYRMMDFLRCAQAMRLSRIANYSDWLSQVETALVVRRIADSVQFKPTDNTIERQSAQVKGAVSKWFERLSAQGARSVGGDGHKVLPMEIQNIVVVAAAVAGHMIAIDNTNVLDKLGLARDICLNTLGLNNHMDPKTTTFQAYRNKLTGERDFTTPLVAFIPPQEGQQAQQGNVLLRAHLSSSASARSKGLQSEEAIKPERARRRRLETLHIGVEGQQADNETFVESMVQAVKNTLCCTRSTVSGVRILLVMSKDDLVPVVRSLYHVGTGKVLVADRM
jgi:hypothetical protein